MALRGYQLECIASTLQLFAQGVRRIAVSLPVGSGKTVVFAHLIPQLPPLPGRRGRVLVLAHRTELLEQAAARISGANPRLRVGVEQGSVRAASDADVVVASVPTLGRSRSARLAALKPSDFSAIIIDEAHHAAAGSYLRILEHFGARVPTSPLYVWGCSATLRRHDALSLDGVFDQIGFSRTLLDMWRDHWLVRPRSVKVQTTTQLAGLSTNGTSHDFALQPLAKTVNTPERNQMVVRAWLEKAYQQGRHSTLVFAVDVAHVKALEAEFRAAGIDARSVDGGTAADVRADNLELFRLRQFPVLINCGVYTEGTDIPCVDCLVFARPTRSPVLFQQMLGRGLRLHPDKRDCLCIDVVDNMTSHNIITLPSLLGLVPTFDAHGADIVQTFDDMVRLAEQHPSIAMLPSLAEAQAQIDCMTPYEATEIPFVPTLTGSLDNAHHRLTDVCAAWFSSLFFMLRATF